MYIYIYRIWVMEGLHHLQQVQVLYVWTTGSDRPAERGVKLVQDFINR